MSGQSQIRRQLSRPEAIERVREYIAQSPGVHRTELADRLCDEFGFVDALARRQRSGCLKSLRVLEKRGHFALPTPRRKVGVPLPRRLASPVPPPHDVPETVGEVGGLELVLVQTEEHMRVWNTLLDEHPRGAGPLVGRQLRYLIGSEHGWLGGIGFAAAALHLEARDRWIGWDVEKRREHLGRIVGMSRLLIRPSVKCMNLASRALGLVMARMPQDFRERYGYEPWLVETFVDTSAGYSGTCYRAANWIRVGSTQGRGRQDRERRREETVKDIYVYVLADDFRTRLDLPAWSGGGPLPLGVGLECETWAKLEFGGARLGDERFTKRLVESATVQAENPTASFTIAAEGKEAMIRGHYRLLDQPDDSAVTMENILRPHREQTIRRMMAHKTVLCVQDGTDLNYNGATECEGLGFIGKNQTSATTRGLHLHSTLVVSDEGLPLGLLRADCTAPQPRNPEDTRRAHEIPLEEKKTYTWVLGMRDCEAVAVGMPHTRIIQVMDREADFFELFDAWRSGPKRTQLLVRAHHDRRTENNALKLFDGVRASEIRGQFVVHIDRQSARAKKSKQKARPARPERTAEMTLRYHQVVLPPPCNSPDKQPVSLWLIHLVEEHPPAEADPIEWFILTTMEVDSPERARRLLEYYCLRWRVEDWHRVLKTGCRIEDLRNETAERIKRALAIYLVIAWRIMLMTLLGREAPDLPPEVLFSDLELEVLKAFVKRRPDLKPPTSLREYVAVMARLGGHMGRKGDPPPGHQALWTAYIRLRDMCAGFLLRMDSRDDP